MQVFKSPDESLGELDARSAANLIAAATDLAFVVDGKGLIRDIALNKEDLSGELKGVNAWIGLRLAETVTAESKSKVVALLREAVAAVASKWRQVNHPARRGADIPVLYAAINIGRSDRYVIVGRDLRPLAVLQQRLLNAQQAMERDYARLRQAETRYRLLFQVSSEAAMIVDSATETIVDVNPAALGLLDDEAPHLLKSSVLDCFDSDGTKAVQTVLASVRATGRESSGRANLATAAGLGAQRQCDVSASLFREDSQSLFLVRFTPVSAALETEASAGAAMLMRHFEGAPDGMVITHHDGRIIKANASFLELAQLTNEDQARGQPLDRWLGRPGVDFGVVMATLRQHKSVRLFATIMRGDYGATADIEVSAVSLANGDEPPHFGFSIRNVGLRLTAETGSDRELPHSADQLRDLIGRVPLRDIVRETTDVIERLSIEAALKLTDDNRASAAEMLGLSRQSLYVKLRRYGIADAAGDGETQSE